MYQFVERLQTLYGLLQDEKSKEIFQARFAIDMEQTNSNIMRLGLLSRCKELVVSEMAATTAKEVLKQLSRENKKIILYGTALTGQFVAKMLRSEHIDFYGFCGRGAEKFPDGLLGKPVFSPDELVAQRDEYYVAPTVSPQTYPEISEFLRRHNYPEDHILDGINIPPVADEKQYFEFPELYRRGTAFIDGGCYNCESSYRFAEWCEGAYTAIIAFEPDPDNYAECCKKVQNVPLPNFQIVNAGLSCREGMAAFDARNNESSYIILARSDSNSIVGAPIRICGPGSSGTKGSGEVTENKISIRTAALDDIVGDRTVGFIKMDIEGAEFDALHGAKNTIVRDKPLLAICVYHLQGDLFAIMDYLHQLLPEYRFLLRHYTLGGADTVLYASVDL